MLQEVKILRYSKSSMGKKENKNKIEQKNKLVQWHVLNIYEYV